MTRATYRKYLLGLLTTILTFNYIDRVALGVLLQDVQLTLGVSDTQMGFLGGLAFAMFYSVMGVPIARWADRGNRIRIIACTTLLWSIGVAACSTAANFWQLLLMRVAVAVGEAGCIPPAFALIADYFSRAERPRAAAIYGLGGGFACVIGYFTAGWLNELFDWRRTFLLLSLPGPVLALTALSTLKEPRLQLRGGRDASQTLIETSTPTPSFLDVCKVLFRNATFRNLLLCLSVSSFFSYGMLQWQPAFFMRSYGLTSGQVGTWLAVAYGVSMLIGTYLGGELSSRYAANDEPWQLKMMACALTMGGIMSVGVYLASNVYMSFACLALATICQNVQNGPLFSTIQTIVPERIRAVAFALVYLLSNLIGMGLGPLFTGALSDAFHVWAGIESLRYAAMALAPGYFWVAWHSWRASRTVTADLYALLQHEAPAD